VADVAALVESLGGFARTAQLLAQGLRELDLTRAVRRGEVSRVRRGWYTTRPLATPGARALRIGGRLTGLSAIAEWGGWVLRTPVLHVSVLDSAARLRPTGKSVRIHWDGAALGARGTATSVGLADALRRLVLDEDLETSVAALDWALHTGRLDRLDFERLLLMLPREKRWIRYWVEARCESLPESLSRTRLRLAGHRARVQVPLGAERVDLLVDELVGLETDGDEFHRDTFERDRRKDLAMATAGYLPIRVPARMVFHEWPAVAAAIDQLLHTHVDRSQPSMRRKAGHSPR
jgi:very-short-patch-repair endonuclease